MTVFIADASECSVFENDRLLPCYEDRLSKELTERIYAKKQPTARSERAVTYLLLLKALNSAVSEKNAREELFAGLYFDKNGRPTFENNEYDLSLSHSDGICVAIVSDDKKRIGIDIEEVSEKKAATAAAVLSRISYDMKPDTDGIPVCRAVRFGEKGSEFYDVNLKKPEAMNEMLISGWTALESALKCHGGGFSALSDQYKVFKGISQKSFAFQKNGKIFTVGITVTDFNPFIHKKI